MIITRSRDYKTILNDIGKFRNVILIGCGRCATSCRTGGIEQIEVMRQKLIHSGKKIIYSNVIEAPCDERLVRAELRKISFTSDDVILSMTCGSGTSVLSDLSSVPVISALDTMFLGAIKRIGVYEERCTMCGDCVLDRTMGICPVTRCSKGLLNGPCGGSCNGKCEVDQERDCAWNLIYENLKKFDRLDLLEDYFQPKNFSRIIRPQKITDKDGYKGKT